MSEKNKIWKSLKLYLTLISITLLCMVMLAAWLSLVVVYPYPSSKYEDLITRLRAENVSFVVVHDCDFRIDGIATFMEVENRMNVSAIYFLRPDADYFTQNIDYLGTLNITYGFHYDCLSRTAFKSISLGDWHPNIPLARRLFVAQLTFLRSFFTINYARSHGDNYNLNINNHDLVDKVLWNELGVTDFSNEEFVSKGYSYISDTNHVWHEPETLGDMVLVNLHSDYW